MNISNKRFTYEKAWEELRTISEPAMLIVALIHLGRLLLDIGEKKVFGPKGLSVHEFEALFIVKHHENITPTLLAQYSLMPPTKITRILDKLEEKGAISRSPIKADRRSYRLSITKHGEDLYGQAAQQFKQAGGTIKKDLGSERTMLLSQLVIGFIEQLGGNNERANHSR